jgi:hypothetical protein
LWRLKNLVMWNALGSFAISRMFFCCRNIPTTTTMPGHDVIVRAILLAAMVCFPGLSPAPIDPKPCLSIQDSEHRLFVNARDFGASGSEYQTTATTAEGYRQITVADAGDFQVGQGVVVSKSNVRYTPIQLWGTGERYRNRKPLDGSVEVRGYDASAGSWLVYVLDIAPGPSPAFRWSDDLGRT